MIWFENVKNWFIVTLVASLILRHELRLYKFEKKIISRKNHFVDDDDDDDDVDKKVEDFSSKAGKKSNKFFGFLSSSFQRIKTELSGGRGKVGFSRAAFSDGTTENFVVKSAFGFLGGVIFTYVCFLFLIYSLNFTLRRATLICTGLGVLLSLGLAFSVKIRCTVLLCMPQLFSKRGRQALLAYAFILALSGPAKNTLHNIEVMSESLACGQEQLKKAENELLRCVHRTNTAVKKSLENMILKLDIAVKGFKNYIEKFYRDCEAVIETIIQAQEWLYSIYCLCNEKMGSPYSRCTNLLYEASQNCKEVSGAEDWQRACDVSSVENCVCPMRNDEVCSIDDLPAFWPFINYQKKLNDFRREALNLIQVKLETHEIFMQPNKTATFREEYQGMATEIRQKTDQFLQYFDLMSVIFGIFILVLFIKVLIYRYKFLTEDDYDNRFITSDFVDIDRTRAEFGMQTLLPLEPRERKKYIRVTSMRLVPNERKRIASSLVFLIFATFKIIIHMLIDYSLYWILWTIRRHGRMLLVSNDKDVPQITVHVTGDGLFADLLRNITKTVRPYAVQQILDPIPCLPDPISPDWNRYLQIMTLVLICWILAFCEPYGLRLRHIVMVTYHPDRARERAIWLYNRILTTRINFVKFARRQLRRKYKDVDEKTYYRRLFWIRKRRLKCLLCKQHLENIECVKCPTAGCIGIYCKPCFETLQLCSICKDPSCYGDYSDVSEEKDSEDGEKVVQCWRCQTHSVGQTYWRRGRGFAEDYRNPRVTYDPGSCDRIRMRPTCQISMDTIADLDGSSTQPLEEGFSEDEENASEESSPLVMRLVSHWKKAFGKNKICEKSLPAERGSRKHGRGMTVKEAISGHVGKLPQKKQLFSVKSLKGMKSFRWKLKDKLSDDFIWKHFKSARYVHFHLERMHRKWESRRQESDSSSEDDHLSMENLQEWKKSVENFSKLLTPDSSHSPLRQGQCEKFSDAQNCFTCSVNASTFSKKVRKEHFQSSVESSGDYQQMDHTDKETQTQFGDSDVHDDSGLCQHKVNSSSRSSSSRQTFHRRTDIRRQKCRGNIRRKRSDPLYETTSDSSQERSQPERCRRSRGRKFERSGQKVLAKKVDTVKERISKLFSRQTKMCTSSEDLFTTEGDECQPFQSDEVSNKMIRPDLLSDLPSSRATTGRDASGHCEDSDEHNHGRAGK